MGFLGGGQLGLALLESSHNVKGMGRGELGPVFECERRLEVVQGSGWGHDPWSRLSGSNPSSFTW